MNIFEKYPPSQGPGQGWERRMGFELTLSISQSLPADRHAKPCAPAPSEPPLHFGRMGTLKDADAWAPTPEILVPGTGIFKSSP